ncbi:hypothetical protein E2C01_091003 [Portunus trituberculatus]|uniref:Uncharacterized protein n=1 Tax=Portunus trituberculatus TaxID=210409 RepID=A0A5B7JRM3_PORTR|nr:hypothetical protein [Portunus trituberculatus]
MECCTPCWTRGGADCGDVRRGKLLEESLELRCLAEGGEGRRRLRAGLRVDDIGRGLVQEASSAWIHQEVVSSEQIHPQDCLLHVRHHKGPRETAAGQEGHTTRLGPIRRDRGAVGGQEVVPRTGLGAAVSVRCQDHTHLCPGIHQKTGPGANVSHPEKRALVGGKPLWVLRWR